MALRFIQKSQLLKQTSIRQATRYFASESKQSAHHYPQESKLLQILSIDELKNTFYSFWNQCLEKWCSYCCCWLCVV
jgi:hypothetical protein